MMRFPEIQVHGVGKSSAPTLTKEDIAAIRERADAISDQQIKTDLFRLLREVEKQEDK